MDLDNEYSALESVENNELNDAHVDGISNVVRDYDEDVNDNKVEPNSSCSGEIHGSSTGGNVDANLLPEDGLVNGVGKVHVEKSPPLVCKSPSSKGYGLRKWRRIKRDVIKDSGGNEDTNKAMKRRESPILENQTKATNLAPGRIKQNSEGSIGSVNMLTNASIGSVFAAGADSDNSEDRSSKSSTAASAPKLKYDLPAVLGYVHERNMIKNLTGKSASSSTQQMKGRAEGSKKRRGERVKTEKENSHSSIISDSSSSNFVFMQGAYSVVSNGKQNGRSENHECVNGGEAHEAEEQEDSVHVKDGSGDHFAADRSWKGREEKSENHHQSTDCDPLFEAVLTLQSVQEALDSEVRKLGEIGKFNEDVHEGSASTNLESSVLLNGQTVEDSDFLEAQVSNLADRVKCLGIKLEEASTALILKESRIAELEALCETMESKKDELREIGDELEDLFNRKMEAEIEYLILNGTLTQLRIDDKGAAASGGTKAQSMKELTLTEIEAASSTMKEVKEHTAILEIEEMLKMQGRVCKTTICLAMQFSLLILVVWLLVLQLSSHDIVVVPT